MDQETVTNESSTALQPLRQPGSLPSEIFIQILLRTLPSQRQRQAPQLKALSLVCRFWHLMVDSTPALWSRISIADNVSHVQKALSRSGEHPIDVCGDGLQPVRDRWSANEYDADSWSTFLAKVQPHAQRWRHVMLWVPPSQRSTAAFTILPSLQTLELCSQMQDVLSDQFLALLNRQHVPRLREVSISSLGIARWDLISLPPTLSKLEISRLNEDYPSIVGWLSSLAACPNLAVFRLYNILTSPDEGVEGDENNAPAVVELNALRQLNLDLVHPDLIIDILKRLRLPEDCAVSISCKLQGPNPSTSFLSPALSSQRNFQRAGKMIQVTVILNEFSQDLLVFYQRWHIYLKLPCAWAIRNALNWFCKRGEDSNASSLQPGSLLADLATSNGPCVTLKLGRNWLPLGSSQLDAISDLPNINRIEMDSLHDRERRTFLLYLSAPEDQKNPTSEMAYPLKKPESNQEVAGMWPFPGLSELVRRESEGVVVYRVLLEPTTRQWSDDAAGRTSGRAKRSELPEPNTPWEQVV